MTVKGRLPSFIFLTLLFKEFFSEHTMFKGNRWELPNSVSCFPGGQMAIIPRPLLRKEISDTSSLTSCYDPICWTSYEVRQHFYIITTSRFVDVWTRLPDYSAFTWRLRCIALISPALINASIIGFFVTSNSSGKKQAVGIGVLQHSLRDSYGQLLTLIWSIFLMPDCPCW